VLLGFLPAQFLLSYYAFVANEVIAFSSVVDAFEGLGMRGRLVRYKGFAVGRNGGLGAFGSVILVLEDILRFFSCWHVV
jgi:hypothetical protein